MDLSKLPTTLSSFLKTAGQKVEGVVAKGVADVAAVFQKAGTAVLASSLPTNLKSNLVTDLGDAETTLGNLAAFAGTEAGQLVGEGVDDVTTWFAGFVNKVSNSKPVAQLSAADRLVISGGASAAIAAIKTLSAQVQAGIDVTAASAQQTLTKAPETT